MAVTSKFNANERLVRKRLAARLRQRRCRERKREMLAQKKGEIFISTSPSKLDVYPVNSKSIKDERKSFSNASSGVSLSSNTHSMTSSVPSDSVMLSRNVSIPSCEAMSPRGFVGSSNYSHSSCKDTLVQSPVLPAPVSPGSSTTNLNVSEAPTTKKLLASREMAAVDAMLALRSNSSSDGEEETASTSSLSTKESQQLPPRSVVAVPKTRIPETVYHHYLPLPYYHHLPPHPQPWGFHHHPSSFPGYYHRHLPPPPPYWKPVAPQSSAASRVRL